MKFYKLILVCLIVCNTAFSQQGIEIGKSYKLESNFLNESRDIQIYLPPSYTNKKYIPAQYPVIYVLDGETHFNFVVTIVQKFSSGNYPNMPEAIVVGIPSVDRYRDFTSSHNKTYTTSGKSDLFSKFLKHELVPFIDENYRTLNYKILIGHSLTGLYAVDLLLKDSNYFDAYVAHDPSFWWNESKILFDLKENNSTGLYKKLFISQVDPKFNTKELATHYTNIKEVTGKIEKGIINNLQFNYQQYTNEDHGSIPLKGNIDALRWIFSGFETEIKQTAQVKDLVKMNYKTFSNKMNFIFIPSEPFLEKVINYLKRINADVSLDEYIEYYIKLYPQSPNIKNIKKGK